jgi:hypothetical protein
MIPWRTFEFRGRDLNDNPFVDFGFVEVEERRLALSSHLLREPLWVEDGTQVMPTFKRYYEAQGFSKLRFKVLRQDGEPVDAPFEEGWEDL